MVISKRYGPIVYVGASVLLFAIYLKATLYILMSSSTFQNGLDLLHATQAGKYASIPIAAVAILVPYYFILQKPADIALDGVQNNGDLAIKTLQDVTAKLEKLNHA